MVLLDEPLDGTAYCVMNENSVYNGTGKLVDGMRITGEIRDRLPTSFVYGDYWLAKDNKIFFSEPKYKRLWNALIGKK